MAFELTDPPFTTRPEPATSNLWHDLRTPLSVIRMQAQLLMRLTNRLDWRDAADRDRFLAGLHRIDDSVTKLNVVLERVRTARREDGAARPEVH